MELVQVLPGAGHVLCHFWCVLLQVLYLHTNKRDGSLPAAMRTCLPACLPACLPMHYNVLLSICAVYSYGQAVWRQPACWRVPQQIVKLLPAGWPSFDLHQVLYLHKNKLDGSLPAAWAGMAALQDLTLSENKLTGAPHTQPSTIWVA
jgi:hypothetical protein